MKTEGPAVAGLVFLVEEKNRGDAMQESGTKWEALVAGHAKLQGKALTAMRGFGCL